MEGNKQMNKFKQHYLKFMQGRYGVDILSRDLLWLVILLSILNIFLRSRIIRTLPFIVFIVIYYRMFSKNYAKRYNENRVYTNLKYKFTKPFIKSKNKVKHFFKYKVFQCPQCGLKQRVPRGKKKIVITCKQCRHQFSGRS